MDKSMNEINMSVDESMVIDKNDCNKNDLNEKCLQNLEKCEENINKENQNFKVNCNENKIDLGNKENKESIDEQINKINEEKNVKPSNQFITQLKDLDNENKSFKLNEVDMSIDDSVTNNDSQTIHSGQLKENNVNKSIRDVDMSIDDSLVLNDIRTIFDTSTSSTEFIISKPTNKIETPQRKSKKGKIDMDVSCSENDSLIFKEIKIENNPTDNLEESPYLKTLPPPKQPFKLSRKRLSCDTISPSRKKISNNLFKTQLNSTPLVLSKKWRSASYNPKTSSPKKLGLVSPLKNIDNNIISSSINNTIDNLLISDLNMKIQKSDLCHNLQGDYTNTCALPLISGRHKDLKTISPESLACLMKGEYKDKIDCFTIIDARYPYEYEGGHIDGSKNIYLKEDINRYFFGNDKPSLNSVKNTIKTVLEKNCITSSSCSMVRNNLDNKSKNEKCSNKNSIKRLSVIKEGKNDENILPNKNESKKFENDENNCVNKTTLIKRHAIIFHCEFSSERGPSLYRYLRKIDRELNENCYPHLFYPEIYILHGGYKLFYGKFKELCYPQTYLPMHSIDHKQDLIKFRTKSKSWNCERKLNTLFKKAF